MAYETTGMPVIMGNNNDGLLGGSGIGALLIGALLFGGGMGGFGRGGWRTGSPAAAAVATDITLQPAFQALQSQISNLSSNIDSNQILAGITSVNQNISGTSRDVLSSVGNVQNSITNGNFTTLQSINGLSSTMLSSFNQQNLQTLNSFNQLNTNLLQGINQINTGINAVSVSVERGVDSINQRLSDCCCELKSTITADGAMTRALINDLNVQSLTSQLNDAKTQIALANQSAVIVNALKPVVPLVA